MFSKLFHRVVIALKALRELGPKQLIYYTWYKLGLWSGYLRWRTDRDVLRAGLLAEKTSFEPVWQFPPRERIRAAIGERGVEQIVKEAGHICAGKVRLFGAELLPLDLTPPDPPRHWTEIERLGGKSENRGEGPPDIKWTWEAARFGWVFTLGRAYYLTGDARYAAVFWRFFEDFRQSNPPNMGVNWTSAQEVAIRLMALVFTREVFGEAEASKPERLKQLAITIAQHAARIPATMVYARAQGNNHLFIEALGLWTAGLTLPEHPHAGKWVRIGRKWVERALRAQIMPDGSYIQQSTNYHRLMLQGGLWANYLAERIGKPLQGETRRLLATATQWLVDLTDKVSGRVPNLGPNDGAYILPLTVCPFDDFRPVLQAACAAFLNTRPVAAGPWDEMSLWFRSLEPVTICEHPPKTEKSARAGIVQHPRAGSWAYLRAVHFHSRPGHADQLHLDLWWRGKNIALDAGTYLYNADPPWDNALSRTGVHNTLTIDDHEQMTWAGRFLWLDWAQGRYIASRQSPEGFTEMLRAGHNGYHKLGYTHSREVQALSEHKWLVSDLVSSLRARSSSTAASANTQPGTGSGLTSRLHWLVPDCDWEVLRTNKDQYKITLHGEFGQVALALWSDSQACEVHLEIVRAGKLVYGRGLAKPADGWHSPTYGYKVPALGITLVVRGPMPQSIYTEWDLLGEERSLASAGEGWR